MHTLSYLFFTLNILAAPFIQKLLYFFKTGFQQNEQLLVFLGNIVKISFPKQKRFGYFLLRLSVPSLFALMPSFQNDVKC